MTPLRRQVLLSMAVIATTARAPRIVTAVANAAHSDGASTERHFNTAIDNARKLVTDLEQARSMLGFPKPLKETA